MKRTLLFACLFASALLSQNIVAMDWGNPSPVAEKKGHLDFIKNYFNLPNCCFRLAAVFSDDNVNAEESTAKQVIEACINALRLEKFPVRTNPQRTAGEYFNCKLLKTLLVTINTDYFEGDQDEPVNEKKIRYLRAFKRCLLVRNFDEYIEKSILYYQGKLPVSECLSMEEIFKIIFGVEMDKLFNVDAVKKTIDALLHKRPLSKREFYDCFKLKPLLEWMGCSEESSKDAEEAIPGMCTFAMDLMKKDPRAMRSLLAFFAKYGKEEVIKPDPVDESDRSPFV